MNPMQGDVHISTASWIKKHGDKSPSVRNQLRQAMLSEIKRGTKRVEAMAYAEKAVLGSPYNGGRNTTQKTDDIADCNTKEAVSMPSGKRDVPGKTGNNLKSEGTPPLIRADRTKHQGSLGLTKTPIRIKTNGPNIGVVGGLK